MTVMSPAAYRSHSLWLDQYPGSLDQRAALGGDTQVDVAIVGGGYTGLWTAYYLLIQDPALRVLVIERDIENLLRRADRDDYDPFLLPGDSIACYDSAITNIAEVGRVLGLVGAAVVLGN